MTQAKYVGFFIAKYVRILLAILCLINGAGFYIYRQNIIKQAIGTHFKTNVREVEVPNIPTSTDQLRMRKKTE